MKLGLNAEDIVWMAGHGQYPVLDRNPVASERESESPRGHLLLRGSEPSQHVCPDGLLGLSQVIPVVLLQARRGCLQAACRLPPRACGWRAQPSPAARWDTFKSKREAMRRCYQPKKIRHIVSCPCIKFTRTTGKKYTVVFTKWTLCC